MTLIRVVYLGMPADEESDVEMESENGEEGAVSYKHKYRDLKRRLKYLVYVSSKPGKF